MPDFLFQRNGVAFGWAEAKNIDKDVIKLKGYSIEQRKRYENAFIRNRVNSDHGLDRN